MKLFMSYPHKDLAKTKELVQALTNGGQEVWFDEQLRAGQLWHDELRRAIQACSGMVLALTSNWINSSFCQWEFITAVELGKPVFPVLLEPTPNLPERISQYQYVDFTAGFPNQAEKIQTFIDDLTAAAVTIAKKTGDAVEKDKLEQQINQSSSVNQTRTSIRIGGNVQGGMVNIGGTQTVTGNVTITMGNMTQTIQKGSATPTDKETLEQLVKDLEAALQSAPAAAQKDVEKVAKRTQEVVEEVSTEDIDKEAVESKAILLKKAAENIASVVPAAVGIAASIFSLVLKMAGG